MDGFLAKEAQSRALSREAEPRMRETFRRRGISNEKNESRIRMIDNLATIQAIVIMIGGVYVIFIVVRKGLRLLGIGRTDEAVALQDGHEDSPVKNRGW